jgi:hypothetical protein
MNEIILWNLTRTKIIIIEHSLKFHWEIRVIHASWRSSLKKDLGYAVSSWGSDTQSLVGCTAVFLIGCRPAVHPRRLCASYSLLWELKISQRKWLFKSLYWFLAVLTTRFFVAVVTGLKVHLATHYSLQNTSLHGFWYSYCLGLSFATVRNVSKHTSSTLPQLLSSQSWVLSSGYPVPIH